MITNYFRSSLPMAAILSAVCLVVLVTLSAKSSEASPRQLLQDAYRIRPGARTPSRPRTVNLPRRTRGGPISDLVCIIEHFPPPDQHLYCCRKHPDCECPRRMGICAPDDVEEESNELNYAADIDEYLAH